MSGVDVLLSVPAAYRWIATVLFAGLIVGLSVVPGVERPDDNVFSWLFANTSMPIQKILHVIAYGVLAFLWMWTLSSLTSSSIRIALSLLLSFGLGVTLEYYQTTIPGRFGTALDILLNTVGIIVGLVVAAMLL